MTQLTYILDLETYPNCFLCVAIVAGSEITFTFEISDYRDDRKDLFAFLLILRLQNARVCGFNIVGFDYPILHMFIKSKGVSTAKQLYDKAMQIIKGSEGDRFANTIYANDWYFELLDLYKIYHYDNRAKSTSLKALEFAMRMDNISDLPFPVGTMLNPEQIEILKTYCRHDVRATEMFRLKSLEQISFREELTKKHGKSFMNHNDTKIGAEIFQMELEKAGVQCYEYGPFGRQMRQTKRDVLHLDEAILPWIKFENPEFSRVLDWLKHQSITEVKGVFTSLVAHTYDLEIVFGTGGLHAAVENESFVARDDMLIESRDVSSYYPNLSIKNRLYPQHLGEKFCDIYQHLYEQRKTFKKGTPENAALKLALNGSFGKAGDVYSIFYDLLFLLKITLNGQLLLCLLIEGLMKVPTVRVIMINTDGLEYTIHPDYVEQANAVCERWQQLTKLELEGARYKKLIIRDCNSYIGEFAE